MADALFESEVPAGLYDDVFAFVAQASFATRITLRLALVVIQLAPILMFVSLRPFASLDRDRRHEVLARLERSSALGLALVAWRTLLLLHFFEDARELARIGYREERKRHLALVPAPTQSGVRLRDGTDLLEDDEDDEEQGAA